MDMKGELNAVSLLFCDLLAALPLCMGSICYEDTLNLRISFLCVLSRKGMVLVMTSILMHMMAAGSSFGTVHRVHPINTDLGCQVSMLVMS